MGVQLGGLGFLHNNMTLEEQLAQAQRVKRHVQGFVLSPAVLSPDATVAEYDALRVRWLPSMACARTYAPRSCSATDSLETPVATSLCAKCKRPEAVPCSLAFQAASRHGKGTCKQWPRVPAGDC